MKRAENSAWPTKPIAIHSTDSVEPITCSLPSPARWRMTIDVTRADCGRPGASTACRGARSARPPSLLAYLEAGAISALEPHDAEDVDDADPQAVEQAVLRDAALARPVVDRH